MSFHKDTKGLVEQAIAKEYENATAVDDKLHKGKHFNSLHEGYGVLLEEIKEAKETLYVINKHSRESLLTFIRYNKKEKLRGVLQEISEGVVDSMVELAQVAAVCKKMLDTINNFSQEEDA